MNTSKITGLIMGVMKVRTEGNTASGSTQQFFSRSLEKAKAEAYAAGHTLRHSYATIQSGNLSPQNIEANVVKGDTISANILLVKAIYLES